MTLAVIQFDLNKGYRRNLNSLRENTKKDKSFLSPLVWARHMLKDRDYPLYRVEKWPYTIKISWILEVDKEQNKLMHFQSISKYSLNWQSKLNLQAFENQSHLQM